MKNIFTFFVIYFVILPAALFSQWSKQSINIPEGNLFVVDISIPLANTAWMVSYGNNFQPTQHFSRTIDGGQTWEASEFILDEHDAALSALTVFALNQDTAWIGGTFTPNQDYGFIARTTDGGQTWIKQSEALGQPVLAIHFWNASEGFALTSKSKSLGIADNQMTTLVTIDGGQTWQETKPDALNISEDMWIYSSNSTIDVVNDHVWFGTTGGKIYHSTDRGNSWSMTDLNANRTIHSIAFKNENYGIAVSALDGDGFPSSNKAWSTSDGGNTWTEITIPERPVALSIEHIPNSPNTYVITGGFVGANMAYTKSDGQYWDVIPCPQFNAIKFFSPEVAWAGNNINMNRTDFYQLTSSFASDHINVKTIAGYQVEGYDANGKSTASQLYNPKNMAVDSSGNIYVANDYTNTIIKITPDGDMNHFAGMLGQEGGDTLGGLDANLFSRLWALTIDNQENLIIGDYNNGKIKKIALNSDNLQVEHVTGTGDFIDIDGSLDSAAFNNIFAFVADQEGNIFVAGGNVIRKISTDGIVSTLAGNPEPGYQDGIGNEAAFNGVWAIAIDSLDNLYVTEIWNHTIRKITPDGVTTTLAGLFRQPGYRDGMGTEALFCYPEGIAVTPDGIIYVADGNNSSIRQIDTLGNVTTLAGKFIEDIPYISYPYKPIKDGDGAAAAFSRTSALKLLPNGDLLVTGWGSDAVRKVQFGVPSSQVVVTKEIGRGEHYVHHINHSDGFSFAGTMENISDTKVENASLSIKAFKNNQLKYLETSEVLDIEPQQIKAFTIENLFEPKEAGTYLVEMQYKIDGVLQHELFDQIIVSDSIMSYDDGHSYFTDSYGFYSDDFTETYGMAYDLKVADTLTGIQLNFGAFDSTLVQFSVYQFQNGQATRLLYQSDQVFFENGYFGEYTHSFEPLALPAGTYLLAIKGLNDIIGISFDNNSISDRFYVIEDAETGEWITPAQFWNAPGYIELTAMIRPTLGERPQVVNIRNPNQRFVKVKVSPNPFSESIQLELNEPLNGTVSLYSSDGKLLQRQRMGDNQTTITGLSNLPKGAYLILLEGKNIKQMTRVMKR